MDMREFLLLLIHLLTAFVKLLGPDGVKDVIAEKLPL